MIKHTKCPQSRQIVGLVHSPHLFSCTSCLPLWFQWCLLPSKQSQLCLYFRQIIHPAALTPNLALKYFCPKYVSHKKNPKWWQFVKMAAIHLIVTKIFNVHLPQSQKQAANAQYAVFKLVQNTIICLLYIKDGFSCG